MAVKQVFNTSAELDYPKVLPTLDLDFANSKTLDPRIDFTRASGGSYVGADGLIKYAGVNEPRFDHDPETGESLGLLVEESRSNLLTYSEDFSSVWTIYDILNFGSGSILNDTTAPDGSSTADLIVENNNSSSHQLFRILTGISDNTAYTYSIFIKPKERTQIGLNMGNALSAYAIFDSSTETFTIGSYDNAGYEKYPNDWYRIWMTATSDTSTFGYGSFLIRICNNNNSVNYQGDGSSGLYVWGAQVEVGAFPTSYIPTQGSTRTRRGDVTRIIGDNFNSFYNSEEFTLQGIFNKIDNVNASYPLAISGSDNSNTTLPSIRFRTNSGRRVEGQIVSNESAVIINKSLSVILSPTKFVNAVISFKSGDTIYGDTGKLSNSSSTTGTVNGANTLFIGTPNASDVGGSRSTCHYKLIRFYPKRLPNEQLQALTE